MLYKSYQTFSDMLAPARFAAGATARLGSKYLGPIAGNGWLKRYLALNKVFAGAKLTHKRPDYAIDRVTVGNAEVDVFEEVVFDLPFGSLLHFAKPDVQTPQPRMLVVAPLSGHFATLLRSTVETLLRDHDVYIMDWKNARDVSLSEGQFGFDDYVDYIMRFMRCLLYTSPSPRD